MLKKIPHPGAMAGLLALALGLASAAALAQPAIWEAEFGTTLPGQALDNADNLTVNLSFGSLAFPFAGAVYTGADVLNISSNGFLSLGGNNGAGCCDGDPAALVGGTFPRIAPFWTDLNPGPGGGGDVYLNTFNDDADPEIDRLVITFVSGFRDCANNACSMQAQVQLLEDGTIIFGYNGIDQTPSQDSDILVGVSPGGGLMDPGPTDFSTSLPLASGAQPTVYQLFASVPPPAFDLDDTNLVFTPNGMGGFDVDDSLADAPAATEPPVWESALGATIRGAATGLDNVDDDTITRNFGSFAFPFHGTTYTGAALLNVSSNGFISLGGDNGDGCIAGDCGGDPQQLTGGLFARIAPLWTDLDPGAAGGDIYLNRFNDDADPAIDRIVITFATGFHDCVNQECAALAQVQLEEDGTITFGYNGIRQTNSQQSNILVGVSPGANAFDPGSTNLSGRSSFDTGSEPTVYELFVATSPPPIDLDGGNVVLTPNSQGGFTVTTPGVGNSGIGGGGGGGGGGGCVMRSTAAGDPLFPVVLAVLLAAVAYRRIKGSPGSDSTDPAINRRAHPVRGSIESDPIVPIHRV
jgi:hypothetical protein